MIARYFISGLLVIWMWLSSALPNGGGYEANQGWTGQFVTMGASEVEMLSEKLNIHFSDQHATVEVTYQMKNVGKRRKVKMGFPVTTTRLKEADDYPGLREILLDDYRITKNGKALNVKSFSEATSPPVPQSAVMSKYRTWVKNWQVSEIPFDKDQTAEVVITYRQGYHKSERWVSDDGMTSEATFSYVFSSASIWKNKIGKGEVTLTVDTLFPKEFQIEPRDRFVRNGNTYTWSFSELEPSAEDDLRIRVFDKHRSYSVSSPHSFKSKGDFQVGGTYVFRDQLTLFQHNRYEVAASSTLSPQGQFKYDSQNVKAWEPELAWVEGAEGDGIGESLTLTLKRPLPIHHLVIQPGYAKDASVWFANNRVAKLEVTANGEKTWLLDIPEVGWEDSVSLPLKGYDKPVDSLVLKIAGVHRGSKYRDTCISYIAIANELDERPEVQGAR